MTSKKGYRSALKTQIVQEILREEKPLTQIASEHGIHSKVVREWKAIALRELPTRFARQTSVAALKADHEWQLEDLYAEIGRLTTQFNWLKKVGSMSRAERLACIARDDAELPFSVQAKLLGISRRSLSYQPKDPPEEEVRIKHRIDEIYTEMPYYGS